MRTLFHKSNKQKSCQCEIGCYYIIKWLACIIEEDSQRFLDGIGHPWQLLRTPQRLRRFARVLEGRLLVRAWPAPATFHMGEPPQAARSPEELPSLA
jgi:hypothetical protein